ncbi:recombinase family protein [Paenibacillus oceani]|uniref:Recombinase family protein n=1 Tax=Paenibacillus oceani TaxID=2772510 RepID=A0A927CA28_9BACL|nr:recombinase family protein [Paenibacillus oceani]
MVKRIFKEYLSGTGVDIISKYLYSEGQPSPAQIACKSNGLDKWHGTTILKFLRNPNYVGDLVHGRETRKSVTSKRRDVISADKWIVVSDVHEPIVSRDDFNEVQSLLAQRKRDSTAPKKHLLPMSHIVPIAALVCGTKRI